jgi:hypothetical protein
MKINLDKDTLAWQENARRFADAELIPSEIEAEMNQGKLPVEVSRRHKKMVIETTATSVDGGFRVNGEKWFVTRNNRADYKLVLNRKQNGKTGNQ